MIEDQELRKIIDEYNALFKRLYEMYGHTDYLPFIVEKGMTNDMQILELFEIERNKFRAYWGLTPIR